MSVHRLLESPLTKGLFSRAIIQSGGGRESQRGSVTLRESEYRSVEFAARQGICGDDTHALESLRALHAETVCGELCIGSDEFRDFDGPIIDTRISTAPPAAAYRDGRTPRIPILLGTNGADGIYAGESKCAIFDSFGAAAQQARQIYDPLGAGDDASIGTRILADQIMLEPARHVARLLSETQSVWVYRFDYVAASMQSVWRLGAPHASEIPYVFATLDARYGAAASAPDLQMSRLLQRYWINFAAHGDPNGAGLPTWPGFDATSELLLTLSRDGSARPMPDSAGERLDFCERHTLLTPFGGPGPECQNR